ncbi:phage protease [Thermomonas sp. S9]|uniref:phage protease n=1 Tax=Thermomonas sp. S9 TaxID=2885203 RepID=UPI00216AD73E|nr:phage protease [Thermomonas sp. S9]
MATPSHVRPRSPARLLARDVLAMSLHADPDPQGGAVSPPEWVHLIPAGVFSGRDGRGPYTLDAAAVLEAFARHGADLPIDYEHQSLTATDKAGPVPAAGWITALDMREDGLWARVTWTPQAAALLAAREYRYLSPVFMHRQDGAIVELVGAGLTHTPNLHLRAAAARQLEAHAVDELLERLIYMLNLPVTATADEVAAELQKLIDRLTAAEAAAQAAQSAQPAAPDPAQWVPMSQHKGWPRSFRSSRWMSPRRRPRPQ